MGYAENYDAIFRGGALPPEAPIAPEGDITAQTRKWLAEQAQRRAMGALPPAAPAIPATPVAPTDMIGRMATKVPTLVRGADGVLRMAGRFGAAAGRAVAPLAGPAGGALVAGGEALGVADVANDPNATKIDVATRAAEGVGRLGAMGAGAGLGATAGSVFGPIGAAAGGILGGTAGYFAPNAIYAARDWWRNRGATPAASATAAAPYAPTVQDLPYAADESGAAVASASPAAPTPLVPWTEADLRNGAIGATPARVPERGTGALQVGRGAVRTLGARPMPGSQASRENFYATVDAFNARMDAEQNAAVPTGRTANGLPDVGGFFGATAHLREIAQDNAVKAAAAKMQVQYGGTLAQRTAQAANENLRTMAAQEHLKAHPGDFAGAAAVAAGRLQPRETYSVPYPPMSDKEPVTRLNRSTGALEKVQPTQYVTEANITASMAARKLTRVQTIDAYKKQGMDVSRITP